MGGDLKKEFDRGDSLKASPLTALDRSGIVRYVASDEVILFSGPPS